MAATSDEDDVCQHLASAQNHLFTRTHAQTRKTGPIPRYTDPRTARIRHQSRSCAQRYKHVEVNLMTRLYTTSSDPWVL